MTLFSLSALLPTLARARAGRKPSAVDFSLSSHNRCAAEWASGLGLVCVAAGPMLDLSKSLVGTGSLWRFCLGLVGVVRVAPCRVK